MIKSSLELVSITGTYWMFVYLKALSDWKSQRAGIIPWLVEVGGKRTPSEIEFQIQDYIMLGDEQNGIPQELLSSHPRKTSNIATAGSAFLKPCNDSWNSLLRSPKTAGLVLNRKKPHRLKVGSRAFV